MEKAMRLVLSGSFHSLASLRRKIGGGIITQEKTYSKLVDKRQKPSAEGFVQLRKRGDEVSFLWNVREYTKEYSELQYILSPALDARRFKISSLRRKSLHRLETK
jgi:hypothetical protein